jgi:hypothetical protein
MRVALFYSVGPHFRRALDRVREEFATADAITSIVPPGLPGDAVIGVLREDVLVTERSHYTPRDLRPLLGLLRHIRSRRFDVFVVMFDSLQLRLFAALSGAPQRMVCLPQGALLPLRGNVATILFAEGARRIRGRIRYTAIWLAIRLRPVRTSNRRPPT